MSHELNLPLRFKGLNIPEISVLDLGCGTRSSAVSKQLRSMPFQHLVGVDASEEYLDIVRRVPHAAYTDYINYDVRVVDNIFKEPKHFDVAVILDVLEHFEKDHGEVFLTNLERLIRKRIIIWMPFGNTEGFFSLQSGVTSAQDLETHKSSWYPEDLRKMGYSVEVFKAFHKHLNPPADAGWCIKDLT